MNYAGKFDAKLSAEGSGLHSNGPVHIETVHAAHVPSDAIIVPDAHLLFHGEFKRSGVDLILSKDAQELVLHDYFKGEKRAALASPDGARLTGDIVNALSGHVEYAQADGSASVSKIIGHVTKLVGTATAVRNGVSIILNNGDNVEKGDVVESGADSRLGITFIDGTVFGLSSNARMVLNEMVYDPNGSNNSSLLSLVAGTMTFVAGDTAKHGDMKIDTPVATMGIRGTAVLVQIDFVAPKLAPGVVPDPGTLQALLPELHVQVVVEPDGTVGSLIMYEKSTLTPLAVADKAGVQINITNGIVSQSTNPLSPELQKLIDDVFTLRFTDNSNTKTLDHFTDTPIPQSLQPIQLASGDTAIPIVVNLSNTTLNLSLSPTNGSVIPTNIHIDLPTDVVATGNTLTARTGASQGAGVDSVSGTIRFSDINAGDLPTVKTTFVSFKLQDAQHSDITSTLTPQQLAQIAAVEAQLVVTPNPGNNNNGSATWTYSVADTAFNFLTVGETLTLTYDAVVDNNYRPNDRVTTAPFTIAISGPSAVEWIHPTGGLWSVGSNWSTGAVPTAGDDTIIPAQNIPGGNGLYDVTIATPAVARNLTLNANNTTGGQLINQSTLTIAQVLTVLNNGGLDNLASGAVTVGGKIELLDQSLLQNSGLITLGQGADFTSSETLTNSGTIEVAGGTLNVQGSLSNAGGTIQVDSGTKLKLSGAAISGGTIDDKASADVAANSSFKGTETNAVLNEGVVTIESGVTLTLDNVTANGTIFTGLDTSSTIQIDDSTILTLTSGATINGGTINDGTVSGAGEPTVFGSIEITGPSTISNALLNNGGVTVASGVTLTLDNDTVNGTAFNDTAGGAIIQIDDGNVLTLTGGATINGGTINDGTASGIGGPTVFGSIDVIGLSTISNVFLNNGGVTVASGMMLTLTNDTVTGTSFIDGDTVLVGSGDRLELSGGSAIGGIVAGTINVSGAVTFQSGVAVNGGTMSIARGATLDIENPVTGTGAVLDDVYVMNAGTIQVDRVGSEPITVSLLLDGGTTVTGGTLLIHIDFPTSNFEGTVEIGTGGATLDHVRVANNNSLTVDDGSVLTLTDGATINGGTINDGTASGTGDPALFGNIDVAGPSTISNALLNNGEVTVASGVTLTLDNDMVNGTAFNDTASGAIIQIDDGTVLTLTGATMNGGIINDGTANGTGDPALFGSIDITGPSTISNAFLNNGGIKIEQGVSLTLDNDMVVGTSIEVDGIVSGPAGKLVVQNGTTISHSQLTIDSGDQMVLNHATINGGTITLNGTIDVTGDSSINGTTTGGPSVTTDAILKNGVVTIEGGQTLTLNNVTLTGTAIEFAGTYDTLKIGQSSNFNGTIGGLATGDAIDLTGITYSSSEYAVWTQTATANGGSGTLKVYDGSGTLESILNLTGIYSQNDFALRQDNTASHGTSVNFNDVSFYNETIHSHTVAASSTIVASAPNQALSGFAASDTFVFNFDGVGHATVTDFHPATDVLQFSSPIFLNALAALNATQDDGHGNSIIAIDAHDTITLSGVLKAQLHASDFHIV